MKISAFEIRPGHLLEYNGKLWRVSKIQHVKPGKGGAFMQVEMKDIAAGTKLNERFRSEDKVEKAHVEARLMQYLYEDGDNLVFMDNESYEQISIPKEDLEDQMGYLLPNTDVTVTFFEQRPIGLELPSNVILEVVETDAAIKGQTASGSGKPARLETGLTVTVPTFINVGDKLKINTGTGEYVERA
ncbi:MAG: elongation factor P [Gammaproteobacteria bacterium]|nr:elongation factor P [Gammaproteobacteria bacterium]